jgi:hypothetical protein
MFVCSIYTYIYVCVGGGVVVVDVGVCDEIVSLYKGLWVFVTKFCPRCVYVCM